jgi:hypothetical protein
VRSTHCLISHLNYYAQSEKKKIDRSGNCSICSLPLLAEPRANPLVLGGSFGKQLEKNEAIGVKIFNFSNVVRRYW